jgi:hypothetical protein
VNHFLPSTFHSLQHFYLSLGNFLCNLQLLLNASVHCLGKHDVARTLLQPGRIVYSITEEKMADTAGRWRNGPVFRKPLLEEAELMLTREMEVVEDVSDCALPTTTDLATHINPPEKRQQIGVDAARKILRGFLQGQDFGTPQPNCSFAVGSFSSHS